MKNNVNYNIKNELEIIKKQQELIIYVYNLLKKFPSSELSLTEDIRKSVLNTLKNLIKAKKNKEKRYEYLEESYSCLNMSLILIRIALKNKYINRKNYTVWSYKVFEISVMLEKWMRACQKQ